MKPLYDQGIDVSADKATPMAKLTLFLDYDGVLHPDAVWHGRRLPFCRATPQQYYVALKMKYSADYSQEPRA